MNNSTYISVENLASMLKQLNFKQPNNIQTVILNSTGTV